MEQLEKMLFEIANMTNENQEKAFAELENKLGKEITDKLREKTFFIKLFTNNRFFDEVQKRMAIDLYKEFTA